MLIQLSEIKNILQTAKTIAVVGISPKNTRPSHAVAKAMLEAGYTIIPINPGQDTILGLPCYPNLLSVPDHVDIVNVFRKPQDIPNIVEEAIAIKARVLWLQLGIINEEAALTARKAGMTVIMDRCLKTDYCSFFQPKQTEA